MVADTPTDGPAVTVQVPGKLNLFLAVRGARPDGYHEVVTVLQTVSLFDRVRAGVVGPPGRGHHPTARRRMHVELRTDDASVPSGSANLAVQAAKALGGAHGVGDLEVEVGGVGDASSPTTVLSLDKAIPVAGGMAGGSADAAATLVALNELWGLDQDAAALHRLAAGLGSDVPFCLNGGTALATGRGTALAQVLCRGTYSWVVCRAAEPLSTAEVYRSWDEVCEPSEHDADAVLTALRAGDPVALGAALHNDLEPAAFHLRPRLREDRDALLAAGALGVVVAGSGPTLLALAEDLFRAARVAEAVAGRFAGICVATSPAGVPALLVDEPRDAGPLQ